MERHASMLNLVDSEASLEKRIEFLKAKEARVSKKDKELSQRLSDLDRRATLIQEVEEKQGAILTREQHVDAQQKEVNQALKEVKKRDRLCKEVELQQSEAEDKIFGKETFLTSQEKELQAKYVTVAEREKSVSDAQFANEKVVRRIEERRLAVEKEEVDVAARTDALVEREQRAVEEHEKLAMIEKDLNEKTKAIAAKEVELQKGNDVVRQRHREITQKEADVSKERDRLNKRNLEISENEIKIVVDLKNLGLKKEEMSRRVAHAEDCEHALKLKTESFRVIETETTKKREVVEKHVVENRKYEEELNALKQELRVQEADLRGRERRLTGLQREHSDREQVLSHRDELLRVRQEEVRVSETDCARREKDVEKREDHVEVFQAEVRQLQERCQQREEAMVKRQQQVEKSEKDLVEWMKEMEWREMMLGDREGVVDREPVTLASTAAGSTSAGFSNKAFGHAMCEVQLRRLKDLYVSAQMKHAREEIRTGKTPFQRHKRLPRAGIVATLASEDVGEVVAKASALKQLRENVHGLGIQFKRLMSRHRAFDSFEDIASPERLEHLDNFSPDERTVLCMAANMEYILHGQEHLLVKLQRSPLDEKDKATNVQDLVNRISRWWRKTEEHVNKSLSELLKDRERYLKHSVAILATKTEGIPAMAKDRRATIISANEAAEADRLERVKERRMRKSRRGAKKKEERDSHHHSSDSDDSRDTRRSSVSDRSSLAANGDDESSEGEESPGRKPYTGTTAYDHIKESKLLAPRGLATLRAVSDMRDAGQDGQADPFGGKPGSKKRGGYDSGSGGSDDAGSSHGTPGSRPTTVRAATPNVSPSSSTRLPPAVQEKHSGRQRPTTQQGYHSSRIGGETRRGIDEPRGVDMTPTPIGHDPETSTMYTGRAKTNKGGGHHLERFDILKVALTTPPRPSPYSQKLHKLVPSRSSQKKISSSLSADHEEGGGSELFPAAHADAQRRHAPK